MAIDILAIPIYSVASKSSFSVGGHIINPYCAFLSAETIEVLMCGGQWIRLLHGVNKPKVR